MDYGVSQLQKVSLNKTVSIMISLHCSNIVNLSVCISMAVEEDFEAL